MQTPFFLQPIDMSPNQRRLCYRFGVGVELGASVFNFLDLLKLYSISFSTSYPHFLSLSSSPITLLNTQKFSKGRVDNFYSHFGAEFNASLCFSLSRWSYQ